MADENIIYDTIIIGAGASGLFCSAAMEKPSQNPAKKNNARVSARKRSEQTPAAEKHSRPFAFQDTQPLILDEHPISNKYPSPGKRLILEKTGQAGTKLLMSGNGQCNITHSGSIKEFPARYGQNGSKIRNCLYKHNNLSLISFLENNGVLTQIRDNGKVFPASMDAHDVLDLLMRKTKENGFEIHYNNTVTQIERVSNEGTPYAVRQNDPNTDTPYAVREDDPNADTLYEEKASYGKKALCNKNALDENAPHDEQTLDDPITMHTAYGASVSRDAKIPDKSSMPHAPLWRVTTNVPDKKTSNKSGIASGESSIGDGMANDTSSTTIKTDRDPGKSHENPGKSDGEFSKPSKRTYLTRNLVIASGGCSYPSTGSDGSMFQVLQKNLSIQVCELHPALSSIQVAGYPYGELAGISFENAQVTIFPQGQEDSAPQKKGNPDENMTARIHDSVAVCADATADNAMTASKSTESRNAYGNSGMTAHTNTAAGNNQADASVSAPRKQMKKPKKILSTPGEALLFTHKDLSGPAILNLSKYAAQGDILKINYLYPLQYQQAAERLKAAFHGTKTNAANVVAAEFNLPKRFCQLLTSRAGNSIKKLAGKLTGEEFSIVSVSGFHKAMATSGGIALSQINTATMEFKELPGLFAIGEAVDVDGVTGGYNLQFAYSSAKAAASAILQANIGTMR